VFSRADGIKQQVFAFARARTVVYGFSKSLDREEDVGPEVIVSDQIRGRRDFRCPRQIRIIYLWTSLKQQFMHFTCNSFLWADHNLGKLAFLYDREMSYCARHRPK
jgi:hypothetical protein